MTMGVPVRHGIIPADAGSTYFGVAADDYGADHPRRCGEHTDSGVRVSGYQGSSPRMRGALIIRRGCVAGVGIIPADAGSTAKKKIAVKAS